MDTLQWLGNAVAVLSTARDVDEALDRSLTAALELVRAKHAYAFVERQGHVDEAISAYRSVPVMSDAEMRELASKSSYSSRPPGRLGRDSYCFPLRSRGRALGAIILSGSRLERDQRLVLGIVAAHAAVVLDNLILCHNEWTRLPNLSAMKVTLTDAVRDGNRSVALFFVDVDNFKGVNSRVGYLGGAEFLIQFASRLRNCPALEAGRLGHISGDEFVFMLPLGDGSTRRVREAARTIKAAMSVPFLIRGRRLPVTVSIGVSVYPDDASSVDELFAHSDRAALDAKRAGKNAYRFFRARARP